MNLLSNPYSLLNGSLTKNSYCFSNRFLFKVLQYSAVHQTTTDNVFLFVISLLITFPSYRHDLNAKINRMSYQLEHSATQEPHIHQHWHHLVQNFIAGTSQWTRRPEGGAQAAAEGAPVLERQDFVAGSAAAATDSVPDEEDPQINADQEVRNGEKCIVLKHTNTAAQEAENMTASQQHTQTDTTASHSQSSRKRQWQQRNDSSPEDDTDLTNSSRAKLPALEFSEDQQQPQHSKHLQQEYNLLQQAETQPGMHPELPQLPLQRQMPAHALFRGWQRNPEWERDMLRRTNSQPNDMHSSRADSTHQRVSTARDIDVVQREKRSLRNRGDK